VIRAVIVSEHDLSRELKDTLLFRNNVERMTAAGLADVKRFAEGARPDVVVIDSEMPGAVGIVTGLRGDPLTRPVAIVALGRSDFGLDHLDMLNAGVNAILPLPPGPNWDDRLMRLVHVPMRKSTRMIVDLAIEGGMRGGLRFDARALNISTNGLLIDCRQPLEIGDDLRLDFELPAGAGPVRATGTVVRHMPPTQYGVELTSAEGDGRQRIKRYVESGAPD
jgi:CheY-like chemotaxis protein